eukprot:350255-Chlamydomonas_euryale.AAC.14
MKAASASLCMPHNDQITWIQNESKRAERSRRARNAYTARPNRDKKLASIHAFISRGGTQRGASPAPDLAGAAPAAAAQKSAPGAGAVPTRCLKLLQCSPAGPSATFRRMLALAGRATMLRPPFAGCSAALSGRRGVAPALASAVSEPPPWTLSG